jgi:DNA mismatch endonuclease, patch repair protein
MARFARNVERDAAVRQQLECEGWRVLVLWECETRDLPAPRRKIREFLAIDAS